MDKGIGVTLAGVGAEVLAFAGTAMLTASLGIPSVSAPLVPHIASIVAEGLGDAVLAVGYLGAVECAAAHLGGEVGAGNAEDLLGHNMVDTLLQVGNLLFQAYEQPFGNFAQEHAALAAWVEKARPARPEQLRWQQVEHPIGQLRRGKDLIAAQVGQAVENVGAIRVLHIDTVECNAMGDTFAPVRRNAAPCPARRRDCTDGSA